jgi:flagellar motor protein MotB
MADDGLSEEASEGYFASVSDLMVGVLFVFLLMLTIFALNFRDDSTTLAQAIARAQQAEARAQQAEARAQQAVALAKQEEQAATDARAEAERQAAAARQREEEATRLRAQNEALRLRLAEAATALKRELRNREAARAGLLQRLADRLDAGGIKFTLDQRSGVLRLSDAIPFATGHSDLTDPKAKQTLVVLGQVLAEVLPCFATGADRVGCATGDAPILETVLVEGHTDSQPYPSMTPLQSQQENDRLSAARALTIFTELRQEKPLLDALRNPTGQPLLGISGYGQRRPLPGAVSSAEADLTRNRRIDLRFVLAARTSDELRDLLGEIDALQQGSAN